MNPLTNKVFSVHIHMSASNEQVYACCLVSRNKDSFEVRQQATGIVDPEDMYKEIPAGVPVILNITGKGILIRQIHILQAKNTDVELVIQEHFPGINPTEFSYQTYTDEGGIMWITLVRKRVLHELLRQFSQKLHAPVYVSAGPFDLLQAPGYVARDGVFNGLQYVLSFRNEALELVNTVQADEVSEGKHGGIDKALEHAYATALNWLMTKGANGLNDETVSANRSNLKFINYAKGVSWIFLIGWLTILLGNFILFNNLSASYTDNTYKFDANASALRQMDSLQQQFREQKQFLKNHNLYVQTHFGFWADRLGASTGNQIVLTDLAFFPLRERNDSVMFDNALVKVKGTANTIFYLNDWINKLKSEKWIREITLENYDRSQSNEPGTFDVQLKLKQQNDLDL